MSLRSFLCQEYYYDRPVPIVVPGSLVFSCRASTAAKIRSSAGSPFRSTRKCRRVVQFQEQSEEYHCSSNTHLPRVEKGGRRQRGPVFNGVFTAFHPARVKAWTRLIFRLASQADPFSRLPGRLEAMSGMIIKVPCALIPQILSCAHIYTGHISSWLWPLKQRPGGRGVYVTSHDQIGNQTHSGFVSRERSDQRNELSPYRRYHHTRVRLLVQSAGLNIACC